MTEVLTYLATFLAGTATGAAGTYFGNKYTDRRRQKEGYRVEEAAFDKMAATMGDLLAEMRADVTVPDYAAWREFFVLPKGAVMLAMDNTFRYEDDGRNAFLSKAYTLTECGYVTDIKEAAGDAARFRMREHFVERLRQWKG